MIAIKVHVSLVFFSCVDVYLIACDHVGYLFFFVCGLVWCSSWLIMPPPLVSDQQLFCHDEVCCDFGRGSFFFFLLVVWCATLVTLVLCLIFYPHFHLHFPDLSVFSFGSAFCLFVSPFVAVHGVAVCEPQCIVPSTDKSRAMLCTRQTNVVALRGVERWYCHCTFVSCCHARQLAAICSCNRRRRSHSISPLGSSTHFNRIDHMGLRTFPSLFCYLFQVSLLAPPPFLILPLLRFLPPQKSIRTYLSGMQATTTSFYQLCVCVRVT